MLGFFQIAGYNQSGGGGTSGMSLRAVPIPEPPNTSISSELVEPVFEHMEIVILWIVMVLL